MKPPLHKTQPFMLIHKNAIGEMSKFKNLEPIRSISSVNSYRFFLVIEKEN
jgi:hypothetical protein